MKRKNLEKSGLLAIRMLRRHHHKQGFPFMINMSSLPPGQCYLEFPNGTIQLVKINRTREDFEVIRELTRQEQISIKKTLDSVRF
jgi:hypothetical protein